MYGVYMRWRMAKWVGQCAVMALMWPGSSTCSSADPLPLERTLLGLLHPQAGPCLCLEGQSQVYHPIHCLAACRQWWVGKAQLDISRTTAPVRDSL